MRFVILSVALLLASVDAANVRQCKNGQPFPMSVQIEGCGVMPCSVVKGTTIVMYVKFLGVEAVTNQLTAKVRATTGFVTVPYELPTEVANVCDNLIDGAECPIYASEDVVYKFNFYIAEWYPEISVKVELSLVDEHNESAACFVTDIKVKKH